MARSDLGTSRLDHKHVVLDEFLDEFDVHPVLAYPGVCAADDAGDAPNAPVDDIVVQGDIRPSEGSTEHIIDIFMGKAVNPVVLAVRNHDRAGPVLEPFDRHPDDLIGGPFGFVLVEFDVRGSLDMSPGIRREKPRPVALGHFGKALHDALNVHSHGIHGSGGHDGLGAQKIPRMGDPVASQNLRPRATHAQELDAFGSDVLRLLDVCGIVGGNDHRFEKERFVTVDNDIDVVFLQEAHIHPGHVRLGPAEQNIRDLGGDHGPAPAVRQGGPGALLHDVFVFLVDPHVGPVHHFHDFAHGTARNDSRLAPGFQGLRGHPLGKRDLAFDLGVSLFEFGVEVPCDIHIVAALDLDADAFRYIPQFYEIRDLVALDSAVDNFSENIEHRHAVIGMGGSAARHHAGKVPGLNGIDRRAANPHLGIRVFRIESARSHEAMLAARRILSDGASLHIRGPFKDRLHAIGGGLLKHLYRRLTGTHFTIIDFLWLLYL